MAVYYDINEYAAPAGGSSVALGYFDGVHLGHRAVIQGCSAKSLRRVVLTFADSPAAELGGACPPILTDNSRKAELISDMGAEDIIFADFKQIRDMSAEDFVREILCRELCAKRVCCGFNYRFGKGGEGDTDRLRELCSQVGIEVEVKEPVTLDGEQVSSSRIRELILSGGIERANAMLGYSYTVSGDISGGNHIGRSMGFPTVNIPFKDGAIVPKYGVYASVVAIDGREYTGATNIGVHPTAGVSSKPLCETFILDYEGGSLYGKRAECMLMYYVRAERRFASLEELSKQIEADCKYITERMNE